MPLSATIILRFGAIIAHVNDGSAMDHAMAAISRAAVEHGGAGEVLPDAMTAPEEAKRSAYRALKVNSLAVATSASNREGRQDVAKRLRLGARSRGDRWLPKSQGWLTSRRKQAHQVRSPSGRVRVAWSHSSQSRPRPTHFRRSAMTECYVAELTKSPSRLYKSQLSLLLLPSNTSACAR